MTYKKKANKQEFAKVLLAKNSHYTVTCSAYKTNVQPYTEYSLIKIHVFVDFSGCDKYKLACNMLDVYDEFTLGAFVGINSVLIVFVILCA